MPRRPSPNSLKSKSLTAIAKNLELLSYGCEKGSQELRDLIETEYFLQIKGNIKEDSCQINNFNVLTKKILDVIIEIS